MTLLCQSSTKRCSQHVSMCHHDVHTIGKSTEYKDASSLASLVKSTSGLILSTPQFQTNSRMLKDCSTARFEPLNRTSSVSVPSCSRNACADRDPCTEQRLQLPQLLGPHRDVARCMLTSTCEGAPLTVFMEQHRLADFSTRFYDSRFSAD